MPQFLLKRIEAIKQYTPDLEVFVYEWEQTTVNYTVQRDKIVELVGKNFFSCGYVQDGNPDGRAENQNNIINYCYKNKIDIIHTEDIVEYFVDRDYNPNKNLLKQIYDSRHPWKIVETPHGFIKLVNIINLMGMLL